MAKTPFMALTGAELKTIVLQRIDGLVGQLASLDYKAKAAMFQRIVKEFDGDQRFEYHLTYPKIAWDATIETLANGQWVCRVAFEQYPGEPASFDVTVTSGVVFVPKPVAVAPRYEAKDDGIMRPAPVGNSPEGEPETVTSHGDDMRSNLVQEHEVSTHNGEVIEAGPEQMPEGWAPPEDREAIRLEIERVARHNARLARQIADGTHEDGGIVTTVRDGESIDRPNAARREAGLPVPKPQQIDGGQIVDLPASENGIF